MDVRHSVDQIILEPRQMLVRQNQPSAVETAAVVDQAVVHGGEHVYIEPGEVELEQLHAALIGFIKVDIFSDRNGVSSGTLIFLTLFIAKMVGRSDFGNVVHAFGAKLHLHVGAGAVVIERNVKRLVAVDILLADVVPVIRLSVFVQQWRGALFYLICRFDREASLL